MSKSGAIRAGAAFVELFADPSKLVRGLKSAEHTIKAWGKNVNEIGEGVASVGKKIFAGGFALKGALSGATAVFAEMGSNLAHMSERTGIGVEALSQLSYAADQTGVDTDALEKGLHKMQRGLVEAAMGSQEAEQTFLALGLSARELERTSTGEQISAIASKIAGLSNPTERAAAAMMIFGRSGANLLPLLNKGGDGIADLMKKADDLGLTISAKDAMAAKALDEAGRSVWATLKGVTFAIGSALAPTLTTLAEKAAEITGRFIGFVKQNRELIVTVSTVATGAIALGGAIIAVGYAISAGGAALTGLAAGLGTVATVLSTVLGVIGFILTPFGLLTTAVVGLGVYFAVTSGKVSAAVGSLKQLFGELSGDFKIAFDAMKTALGAGDFQAAAQVLWAFLKLEFVRGVNFCKQAWTSLRASLSAAFDSDNMFFGLRAAWIDICAFMAQAWVKLMKTMTNFASSFQNSFAKQWINIWEQVVNGKSADEAQEIIKTFAEDQKRRGGHVVTNVAFDKRAAEIEAQRKKDQGDNSNEWNSISRSKRQGDIQKKWFLGIISSIGGKLGIKGAPTEEDKAKAELDKAKANLASAADAANAAKGKSPAGVNKAGASADESGELAKKAGSVSGTFSGFGLWGLGGSGGPFVEIAKDNKKQVEEQKTTNKLLKKIAVPKEIDALMFWT